MTSIPSNLLGQICFVSTRKENPEAGFQRLIDEKRAREIATYVDSGIGTIPQAVVLSAQSVAGFEYNGKKKTISFNAAAKSFLIIDGQHRIYGFRLAKKDLRVPAIIYTGLTRTDETKLFIDINTKQRPVPTELLLDIKALADYETESDQSMRVMFDFIASNSASPLAGDMNANKKERDKITRVTFNESLKSIVHKFQNYEPEAVATFVINYLNALVSGEPKIKAALLKPTTFRAFMELMVDATSLVVSKYGKHYTENHYAAVLSEFLSQFDMSWIKTSNRSHRVIYDKVKKKLEETTEF